MRLILALVVLAGCSPTPIPVSAPAPVYEQPSAIVRVDGGEILVVQVPIKNHGQSVEHQKCFIWKDRANNTSSMQCPNDRTGYTFDSP